MVDQARSQAFAGEPPPALVRLAAMVGDPGFGDALITFLDEAAQVEHVLVFAFDDIRLVPLLIASRGARALIEQARSRFLEHFLRVDPQIPDFRAAADCTTPRLFRADPKAMPHRELFELLGGPHSATERLVVTGKAADIRLTISLVRSPQMGRLDEDTAERLLHLLPLMLALIASHVRVTDRLAEASRIFSRVEDIEKALDDIGLSLRQMQVCARILFGMSTEGIALDLEIGTETVITHRKHAYQRLEIANQFELMRWYLNRLAA